MRCEIVNIEKYRLNLRGEHIDTSDNEHIVCASLDFTDACRCSTTRAGLPGESYPISRTIPDHRHAHFGKRGQDQFPIAFVIELFAGVWINRQIQVRRFFRLVNPKAHWRVRGSGLWFLALRRLLNPTGPRFVLFAAIPPVFPLIAMIGLTLLFFASGSAPVWIPLVAPLFSFLVALAIALVSCTIRNRGNRDDDSLPTYS